MTKSTDQNFEIRLLSAVRKTLINIAKDTMTKPGLRHPLSETTQKMLTDCLDIVTSRQIAIEKDTGKHTKMKPVFSDEQTVKSVSLNELKKSLK